MLVGSHSGPIKSLASGIMSHENLRYLRPVSFNATDSEMDQLLKSLNGFLFTGG